jgi:hypothetical protein
MSGKWDNPNVPKSGWECIDVKDYGKTIMTCQMCERENIRYAHFMRHPAYKGILIAGCICAGKMEGNSKKATKRDSFMKSRTNKRKNWLTRKWKISKKGNQYEKTDGFVVVIVKVKGLWSAYVKSEYGSFSKWSTQKSKNENEIKLAAFDILTTVLAEKEFRTLGNDEAEYRIINDNDYDDDNDYNNDNDGDYNNDKLNTPQQTKISQRNENSLSFYKTFWLHL